MRDFVKKKDVSWLFFKSSGKSECLCMDGKEVTCASAPPAKFRSAKGDDYAGEFLFFYKTFFVYLFFKFTGNRRSARKEKSGLGGLDYCMRVSRSIFKLTVAGGGQGQFSN